MTDLPEISTAFRQELLRMDRIQARRIIQESSDAHGSAAVIERVIVPALEEMGAEWESGDLALSQIYMAGRICEELVDEILPPASPQRRRQPKIAIVTLDDYHFLGKRIIYAGLRAAGFELLDFGRMTADELVPAVSKAKLEVLLISTLMLPSALNVRDIITALGEDRGCRIIVGGAPFRLDAYLWRDVGADAMGTNLEDALRFVQKTSGGPA